VHAPIFPPEEIIDFHSVGSEKDGVSGKQLQYPIKSSFGKESNTPNSE